LNQIIKKKKLVKSQIAAWLLCLPLLAACPAKSPEVTLSNPKIKPDFHIKLQIAEPSDIALSADGKSFYIVSDNGQLFQTDLNGTVIAQAEVTAYDLEAVYANANYVIAVDERTRMLHFYTVDGLKHERQIEVSYPGGRNKGFESLTYNTAKNCFCLITEKDPKIVFELDPQTFAVRNQVEFKGTSDLSSATMHNGKLYFLSDEEHCVLQVDPTTYKIIARYETDIINPEGIAFLPDGRLVIVSDDMGTLYNYFAAAVQ
jgi:uncharacterized protein YjiK